MTIMSSAKEAPEHIFAKKLAANDKKIRDKAVKKLKKWLSSQSSSATFSALELQKIWKGLFYCMYMSDKPLIQEELSENIGDLIHAFGGSCTGLEFFRAGLQVISSEWNGLDKWRMDKFMMLLRRLLRHSFMYVAKGGWTEDATELLAQILSEEVINANKSVTSIKTPLSIQVLFTDMLLEELAKVGGEKLGHEVIMPFIEPFIEYLAYGTDPRLRDAVKKSVFYHLINQSDVGIAHESGITVDELKEALEGAELPNLEDQPKDPRAGKVDIALPQLRPNYEDITSQLLKKAGLPNVRNVSRKFIYKLVENFKDLTSGVYPLAPVMPEIPDGITYEVVNEATEKYLEEEEELRRIEKEEKKKLRKRKVQEEKEEVVQKDDEPVQKSNKQLRKEKREMEFKEKLAKKAKLSEQSKEELHEEDVAEPEAAAVVSNSVVDKPIGGEKETTKKDNRKKVKVPKSRSAKATEDNSDLKTSKEATPPSKQPLKWTSQPQKRKIEFSFDDDVEVDEAAVLRAIKKTKQEPKGPWVPGVKTIEELKRQARRSAKKSVKKEKVVEKPQELLENAPFAVLKSSKKQVNEKRVAKDTSTPLTKDEIEKEVVTEAVPVQCPAAKEEPAPSVPANEPVTVTPPISSPVAKPEEKESWNESLQEGEIEIVIPNKKYTGKYKLKAETKVKETESKKTLKTTLIKSSKVKFVLQKNKAQDPLEYMHAVQTSPGIPHDPNKKPKNGVLKLKESPVPVMPSFEKKKKKSPAKFMTNVAKRKFVR